MKRLFLVLGLFVLGFNLAACNGDSPTKPSTGTTSTKLTAVLLPANEVPAIVGAEAAGSGTVAITLDVNKDSNGYITSATADFVVTVTGFPNGTTLTGAHIHAGDAGVNGGIQVSLGLAAGEISFPNGAGTFNKNNITVTVDQANAILANPSSFYFNIHTAANPGGVARGQLAIGQ
jgi:hypothetical protein